MPHMTGPASCSPGILSRCGVAVVTLVVAVTGASAQSVPDTTALQRALAVPTTRTIDAHIKFLADDLLEGRAPGTRGAAIAARYIQSRFEEAGLQPGAPDGTFFQQVRLVGVTPSPSLVVGVARRTMVLQYLEDFVAWPQGPDRSVIADGEIVFVGYGIDAPAWNWDDYKLEPLTGKILLMLVNDPGLRDSSVFNGPAMTYYGSWTYKLEQAARLGAAGALLIHTNESATYPWTVVQNSWSGQQIQIEGQTPQTLRFGAWITERAARQIVRAAGIDYDLMVRRAARRDFHPVTLNAHAVIDIASRGIRVTMLFSKEANIGNDINYRSLFRICKRAEIAVYLSDKMIHSKLMVIDDEIVILGSANISVFSMQKGVELDIVVKDNPTFVESVRETIDRRIGESTKVKSIAELRHYNPVIASLQQLHQLLK